jgi:hypothetical protein
MILFISSAWLGGMDFELDRNLPSHGNSSSWKVSNLQKLKKSEIRALDPCSPLIGLPAGRGEYLFKANGQRSCKSRNTE